MNTIDRETFKLIAAGQFAYNISNDTANIDVGQMRLYVDGAVFAFDKMNKPKDEATNGRSAETATGYCINVMD